MVTLKVKCYFPYMTRKKMLERKLCSIDQIILQCLAEFDEVCAVAGNADQHILILFRVLLGRPHGFGTHDIELHMHRVAGQILVDKSDEIVAALSALDRLLLA